MFADFISTIYITLNTMFVVLVQYTTLWLSVPDCVRCMSESYSRRWVQCRRQCLLEQTVPDDRHRSHSYIKGSSSIINIFISIIIKHRFHYRTFWLRVNCYFSTKKLISNSYWQRGRALHCAVCSVLYSAPVGVHLDLLTYPDSLSQFIDVRLGGILPA